MNSIKLHDVRVEKTIAIAKYRRNQRIARLFRFVELLIFLIILSRSSNQFASSVKISGDYFRGVSGEYFRGVSATALFSPRSVFFVGNAIVVVLFLISGQVSGKKGERSNVDFYDEYVENCRKNQQKWSGESDAFEGKVMRRIQSANFERVRGEERRRELRRSASEKCRKGGGYPEDEMSSEEFRRTVEAFIARQQRSLMEA